MLNNFIYAETKDLFLEQLNAGNILDEAIVFIKDTREIWNHGTYFKCHADISDGMSDEEIRNIVETETQRAQQVESDIISKLQILIGTDAWDSIRNIIKDELDTQLKSDDISESFDTIKEIAEYLSNNPSIAIEVEKSIKELQENKADKATTLAGYGITDAVSTNGGMIKGTAEGYKQHIIKINTDNPILSDIQVQMGDVVKAGVGYSTSTDLSGYRIGAFLYNTTAASSIGITDDGTPYYNNNTLIHSGNIGDYALKTDGSNKMKGRIDMDIYAIQWDKNNTNQLLAPLDADSRNLVYYDGTSWKTIAFTDSNVASANYATNAGNAEKLNGYSLNTVNSTYPYNAIPLIDANGVMEIGKYIDFHWGAGNDYDVRIAITKSQKYKKIIYLPEAASGTLALLTDNVASATKLQTPRKLWGQRFDGSTDVSGALIDVTSILPIETEIHTLGTYEKQWKVAYISEGIVSNYDDGFYIGSRRAGLGSTDDGALIYTYGNNPISLYTNKVERIRVTGEGNVLIGTTNDTGHALKVNGNIYSSGIDMINVVYNDFGMYFTEPAAGGWNRGIYYIDKDNNILGTIGNYGIVGQGISYLYIAIGNFNSAKSLRLYPDGHVKTNSIMPMATSKYDLGSSSYVWNKVYTNNIDSEIDTTLKLSCGGVNTLTVGSQSVSVNTDLYLSNNKNVYIKDTDDAPIAVLKLTADNFLLIGAGTYSKGYPTLLYGHTLNFKYGSDNNTALTINENGYTKIFKNFEVVGITTLQNNLTIGIDSLDKDISSRVYNKYNKVGLRIGLTGDAGVYDYVREFWIIYYNHTLNRTQLNDGDVYITNNLSVNDIEIRNKLTSNSIYLHNNNNIYFKDTENNNISAITFNNVNSLAFGFGTLAKEYNTTIYGGRGVYFGYGINGDTGLSINTVGKVKVYKDLEVIGLIASYNDIYTTNAYNIKKTGETYSRLLLTSATTGTWIQASSVDGSSSNGILCCSGISGTDLNKFMVYATNTYINGITNIETLKIDSATLYYDSTNNALVVDDNIILHAGNYTDYIGNSSDRRLKSEINTITDLEALSVLTRLNPVTFIWNAVATSLKPSLIGESSGFVAEEYESVIPNSGFDMWDKQYRGIDYTRVSSYLVAGWQNHERRIEAVENKTSEIDQLKKLLEAASKKISELEAQLNNN